MSLEWLPDELILKIMVETLRKPDRFASIDDLVNLASACKRHRRLFFSLGVELEGDDIETLSSELIPRPNEGGRRKMIQKIALDPMYNLSDEDIEVLNKSLVGFTCHELRQLYFPNILSHGYFLGFPKNHRKYYIPSSSGPPMVYIDRCIPYKSVDSAAILERARSERQQMPRSRDGLIGNIFGMYYQSNGLPQILDNLSSYKVDRRYLKRFFKHKRLYKYK